MQYGSVSGLNKPVSRIVQGTVMISSADPGYSNALLDAVFAAGCNTFDTGHIYGGGDNERSVGRWVNERGIRDKVVLIGKGAHHNADRRRVTPWDITSDLYDSLARFQTDYIDLYLLHRDDTAFPVGPIVEVLNEHREAGRIRAFGGSNWSTRRLREANEYASQRGLTPFAASSPHFSLAEQYNEPWDNCVTITGKSQQAERDWYRESQMPLFTWSSIAAGFFTGNVRRDNAAEAAEGPWGLCAHCYAGDENFERLDRAEKLARDKGMSASQIALAWALGQGMNLFPLVGARTQAEFAENVAAFDLKLTADELAWLNLDRG